MSTPVTAPVSAAPTIPEWLAIVRDQVEGLRFGVVQLVIHEGRVTQIERTEKVRLGAAASRSDSTP